ncbi:MAG: HAMP domain-containing sensor histidine kinase [Thermoleophilia bacterium]
MSRRKLGVRSRLLLSVISIVALTLVIAVVGFYVFLGQRLSSSATSLARSTAAAELSSLELRAGRLVAPDGPDEDTRGGLVWVFAADGAPLEQPRLPQRLHAIARSLATAPEGTRDLGESYRFYALPVTATGTRYGTVVAAVSLEPYEQTARSALIGAGLLALVALVATALISRWVLGRALRPVARMTRDASEWSEHDLDHRFHVGEPYDELTTLASTFDGLLERLSASLRRERRFTAEVSHELRTPLAAIRGEAELLERRPRSHADVQAAASVIGRNADRMTRTIESLLAAWRTQAAGGSGQSDIRDGVRLAVETSRPPASLRLTLELPDQPLEVSADADLVERMLQPLLDNALAHARTAIRVAIGRDDASAIVVIDDDGPGLADQDVERIFDPGVRGDNAAAGPGAGLGLALARRLARSAGGDVTAHPAAAGATFQVRLPLRPDRP